MNKFGLALAYLGPYLSHRMRGHVYKTFGISMI